MANDETYSGTAYCVKCREKREFTGIVVAAGKDGSRRIAKGDCPVCGSKVTRILGKVQTA